MDSTPRVLQNQGIKVSLGEEKVELRLTIAALAAIEEDFGSVEDWQTALTTRPSSACRQTVAIAINRRGEDEAVGQEMTGSLAEYMTAITVAWSVANGLDPTVGAEVFQKAMDSTNAAAAGELLQAIQESATKEV